MFETPTVVPSILSADFGNLRAEMQAVEQSGARVFHLDIMDGLFVPNLTFGMGTIQALRPGLDALFDIHLMIVDPLRYTERFAQAGKSPQGCVLTVHAETVPDLLKAAQKIHALGKGVLFGAAVNPETPVSVLEPAADVLDLVTIMTVHPGYGGQSLLPECVSKIGQVRQMARLHQRSILVEVDGGVKLSNMELVKDADILVMGSAVYASADPAEAGMNFRKAQAQLRKIRGLST